MAVIWTIDSKTERVLADPVDTKFPSNVVISATRTDGEVVTRHRVKMVLPATGQDKAIAAALDTAYTRSVAKATAQKTVVDALDDAAIMSELGKLEVARG